MGKQRNSTLIALGTLGAMLTTTLGGGLMPAHAGSKGRRNTALALGAITVYGLLKGNNKVAIAGGVGTAIAYSRYRSAKKRENRYRYGRYNRYGDNAYNAGRNRYSNSRYGGNRYANGNRYATYGNSNRRSYRRGNGHYKGRGKGHRKHGD